jgi:transposase-like protein
MAVKDLCREHGLSEVSFYLWRSKFGAISVGMPSSRGRPRECDEERPKNAQGGLTLAAYAQHLASRAMINHGL